MRLNLVHSSTVAHQTLGMAQRRGGGSEKLLNGARPPACRPAEGTVPLQSADTSGPSGRGHTSGTTVMCAENLEKSAVLWVSRRAMPCACIVATMFAS